MSGLVSYCFSKDFKLANAYIYMRTIQLLSIYNKKDNCSKYSKNTQLMEDAQVLLARRYCHCYRLFSNYSRECPSSLASTGCIRIPTIIVMTNRKAIFCISFATSTLHIFTIKWSWLDMVKFKWSISLSDTINSLTRVPILPEKGTLLISSVVGDTNLKWDKVDHYYVLMV